MSNPPRIFQNFLEERDILNKEKTDLSNELEQLQK